MSQIPPAGTPAKEFFERFVPEAFAANPIPDDAKQVDVMLGVRLEGDGGGEWRFHLKQGELQVAPGATEDAAFTVIQSVVDWRGALWEGRGGPVGRLSQTIFQSGAGGGASGGASAPSVLGTLNALQALRGVIKMVVMGDKGGDWAVAVKLGPGPVPAQPTTTVSITADDAAALERGELDPMQAFMAGRIQVAGDISLLMQMQAAQMQAAASQPGKA